MLLPRSAAHNRPRLDIPGVLLVSGGLFCLVYGFSNAATHSWHAASTYGFLIAGVALLAAFAFWQARAANPLLPPRVVLDRNRGAAYLSMLVASAAMFGTFLFLTYYLQQTLGYSPIVTGFAVLPIVGGIAVSANVSNIVLMPRLGPKPLVAAGMLIAAGAAAWFAQLGPHTSYAGGVLGPLILTGVGLGMVIAPSINTGTFGVAPQDAGVASATVTVGQQLGASIGTSLLNTVFAGAVTSYVAAHAASARSIGLPALTRLALVHGYDAGFWWTSGILAGGAVLAAILFRRGPLSQPGTPAAPGDRDRRSRAERRPGHPGLRLAAGYPERVPPTWEKPCPSQVKQSQVSLYRRRPSGSSTASTPTGRSCGPSWTPCWPCCPRSGRSPWSPGGPWSRWPRRAGSSPWSRPRPGAGWTSASGWTEAGGPLTLACCPPGTSAPPPSGWP